MRHELGESSLWYQKQPRLQACLIRSISGVPVNAATTSSGMVPTSVLARHSTRETNFKSGPTDARAWAFTSRNRGPKETRTCVKLKDPKGVSEICTEWKEVP